jgi:hypothetical protein
MERCINLLSLLMRKAQARPVLLLEHTWVTILSNYEHNSDSIPQKGHM